MTLAVGFFDGVHLGHQAILKGADRAFTFTNHPLSLLAPDRAPALIMTCDERLRTIGALGVRVTALDFDTALASETPERFLERLRAESSTGKISVRCGANWRFGKDGVGDAAWLRAHGVDVTVVPYAAYGDAPVSSTRIRRALEVGAVEDAGAMLGRPYAVSGEIVRGKGLGRTMGYPTLNVMANQQPRQGSRLLRLPFGVYAAEIGGLRAVANYGLAPTMGERAWKQPVWEIHVLNNRIGELSNARMGELADHRIGFSLLRFLRPEQKFASVEKLTAQIARDVEAARGRSL